MQRQFVPVRIPYYMYYSCTCPFYMYQYMYMYQYTERDAQLLFPLGSFHGKIHCTVREYGTEFCSKMCWAIKHQTSNMKRPNRTAKGKLEYVYR